MTTPARPYRLFDRAIWSARPLRLLPGLTDPDSNPGGPEASRRSPTADDVFVEWSADLWEPPAHARPVIDVPWLTSLRWEGGYCLEIPRTGLRVGTDLAGRRLHAHPATPAVRDWSALPPEMAPVPPSPRLSADSLVTNILPLVCGLWGVVPLHAACLDTGAGLVLLVARTGTGKSTLSQHLARVAGWTVLDDDTTAVRLAGRELQLIPMSARPRVRADAAADLGIRGDSLPGYVGAKQALAAATDEQLAPASRGVLAVVHLVRSATAGLTIEDVDPPRALAATMRSMFTLDPTNTELQTARMSASAALAGRPNLVVRFKPDAVTAQDLAGQVAAHIDAFSQASSR